MTIQFLGATRTVTGSMHLVEANGKRILLDCGLFQGKRKEAYERNKTFLMDPASIDAVVLSHAHIDHAGNLPNLVKQGFNGPIYSTHASVDLCKIMLYDSAYIQERDFEFLRKRGKSPNGDDRALYSTEDVDRTLELFVGISYGRSYPVVPGVILQFRDAGHILGSAVLRLEIEEKSKTSCVGFTGDLGRVNMPILRDPQQMGEVDVLISESTYGGRIHEPIEGMAEKLAAVIKRTVERGGKIIVPAFSVGKTQELIYSLSKLADAGEIPDVPVYIDSPLAVNATEVFRTHPECFDRETLEYLRNHHDPFGFNRLRYVRSVDESKALNDRHGPMMIIAGSGMCEGGRILHHLANNVEDSRNTVLVIGFMAEHTLGRRIVERHPEIKIFGDLYKLKAEVAVLDSFSAHAGQDELVSYIAGVQNRSDVFLVHGDLDQAEALSEKLKGRGIHRVHIPARGEKKEYI